MIVVAALVVTGVLVYLEMPKEQPKLELTRKEFTWLQENAENIRLAPLPDSRPVDFIDDKGRHAGLTADYLRLIENKLGLRFRIVQCENWAEILEKLRNQEIDLVGSVQNTPERQGFLRFTEPYFRLPTVILTRQDWSEEFNIDNLQGMPVVVVEGSAIHGHVAKLHPEYNLVPVKDAGSGFRMVSFSEADAMVADLGVASHYIDTYAIANLRVAGDIDYPWDLCLASRKDWPLLNSILNKALAHITLEQRRAIKKQWITLDDTVRIPREDYLKVVGGILIVTLLAIGSVMFWNQTLRKQVTHRTEELGQVRQSHAQATRALGESEERFRALVESSSDMIWEMDFFGSYLYVSPRVREILGYTPEELIGKSSFSFMDKEESARNLAALRTSTVNYTFDCEINTFIHKNGQKVILESSGRAFANNKGEVAGFRGVARNITERIENEGALRRSEERFRNLVETSSDWIWEVDNAGNYTYASPQVETLLGFAPNELIGRHFTENMPPQDAESSRSQFAGIVARGGAIHASVSTNRHKDGRTVMLETSAVPFYDKDWNIQGYRGIVRDITDRVAFEKELEFERNLFRTFMEHAPDLIYFKDAKGRFIEVNSAKAKEVQLSPEDLIGHTDFDYLPQEQAQVRLEDEREVMRTRKPLQKEELATTPSGDCWYLTTKVPHHDGEGNVVGTFGTSWNITYRKLAEEQLRQLRALLSNTIDSMPSILVGVDSGGTVIQWNRQAVSITGIQPVDAIGRPLREAFPGLVKEMVKVERALRERAPQQEERIRIQENGRTRYNDITVFPLLDGETEGAVIRVDDVTDRVMIEDSIRNIVEGVAAVGRRFFKSMVDQLAKTLDADFTFISEFIGEERTAMRTIAVSDRAQTGANFEFDLANTPCELVLKGDSCLYIERAQERYPDTQMLHNLDIDGYIGIPLVDSEENALGMMVAMYRKPVEQVEFATSIMQVFAGRTAAELERLQATKELVALQNLMENIINSMPSIIVGVDADRRVMQWNHQAESLSGMDAARAHGQPLDRVFPDLGNEMNRVLETMGSHGVQHHERIHCSMKGEPHMVDVTIYPITTDGSEGAVIRIDDVTDRVRIEEMMIQSEKMMSVGGLAAGMAHEINNPLAGILQNLQVMRNRVTHNTDRNMDAARDAGTSLEAIQNYMEARGLLKMMESISEAGRRAAKIVDNMLSFSRKDEAHFAPNDLEEIIERSIELASNDYNLKKRFDFRHIRIDRDFDELEPIPCEGSQVQQVMLNLLSNSAQAMAARPDEAPEPRIVVRLKKEKDMALIEVEDNGPGMDEETRKRAFEPFFTTKEVGHGTGLGLSVSYFIITENHGGTMNVHSAPGRGARFSIRIPYEHRMERWGLRL
ncbi:Virulence sensor protein BvgS [Pontiella desulfatans]|uniref:histidine kinase n=2 Tax=Pontiella desulfatans TaxID=2750659 RepID=A0A6C2UBD7_PONDE|nr:Virulence sensor protein BvgS [Pontiella desulfatans]